MNGRYIILKIHYAIKRGYRIFEIGERVGFIGSERVTAVEVPLQRIFTTKVIESFL